MPCSAQPETQDAGFCLKIRTSKLAHGSNATMAPSLKGYHGRREVCTTLIPDSHPRSPNRGAHIPRMAGWQFERGIIFERGSSLSEFLVTFPNDSRILLQPTAALGKEEQSG